MILEKMVLANALALATAILWFLCSAFVLLFPVLSMSITLWLMHVMKISVMGNWNLNLANFILGGLTISGSAWVSGFVFGWSWEKISKR